MLSKWHGVHCDPRSGRVTRVDLRDRGLEGEISPAIVQLTHLECQICRFADVRAQRGGLLGDDVKSSDVLGSSPCGTCLMVHSLVAMNPVPISTASW